MYLEINMPVIRNDKDITLTITAKSSGNTIHSIFAYDNFGNQIHLSLSEEICAEQLLFLILRNKSCAS
jgi:hypothetical protein